MHFDLASCPTGWTEFTATRGRYMVGMPAGGTLGGSVGTALTNQENRATGLHSHAVDPLNTGTRTNGNHGHAFYTANHDSNSASSQGYPVNDNHIAFRTTDTRQRTHDSGTIIAGGDHSHTVDIGSFNSGNSGSVAGTNAPYVQLLFCKKN